ncbi:MAG: hypothetical protein WBR13_02415 [Allosphingosinicella sp.]
MRGPSGSRASRCADSSLIPAAAAASRAIPVSAGTSMNRRRFAAVHPGF